MAKKTEKTEKTATRQSAKRDKYFTCRLVGGEPKTMYIGYGPTEQAAKDDAAAQLKKRGPKGAKLELYEFTVARSRGRTSDRQAGGP